MAAKIKAASYGAHKLEESRGLAAHDDATKK
jgi:hypothetical protein